MIPPIVIGLLVERLFNWIEGSLKKKRRAKKARKKSRE